MKRIPLEVYNFSDDLRIMAHFLLKIEGFPRHIPIRAIVDTGSPITLIGTLDTKRIRFSKIQLKKLVGKNKPVNIGGGKIFTKILENSKLKFSDGFEFEMPVEFPVNGQENPFQPSLIGVDFMIKSGSKLVFDPSKKLAYFEIDD